MKLICINKKYYTIPENWNELTAKQLQQVMEVLFLKGYTAEQMLLKLLKVLTGVSTYRFFKMDVEELEEYFYLLHFLLKDKIEFTTNLVPVYNNFYGPSSGMDNVVMSELALTEDFITKWYENKEDEEAINNLVALLYRPAKRHYDFERDPDGDPRVAMNQYLCLYHAKNEIKQWPMALKLGIVYWYVGCRQNITERYDEVFGGGGEASEYGLVDTMMSVAEGGVFGTFEKVEKENINTVLMHLTLTIKNAKKLEAQMK